MRTRVDLNNILRYARKKKVIYYIPEILIYILCSCSKRKLFNTCRKWKRPSLLRDTGVLSPRSDIAIHMLSQSLYCARGMQAEAICR